MLDSALKLCSICKLPCSLHLRHDDSGCTYCTLQPWEDAAWEYPESLASPQQILADASNGASDYGNKFGEPVLAGYTRTFGMRLPNGERREWIKPIMFRHARMWSTNRKHHLPQPLMMLPDLRRTSRSKHLNTCVAALQLLARRLTSVVLLQCRAGADRPQPPGQAAAGAGHGGGQDRRAGVPHRHGWRRGVLGAVRWPGGRQRRGPGLQRRAGIFRV